MPQRTLSSLQSEAVVSHFHLSFYIFFLFFSVFLLVFSRLSPTSLLRSPRRRSSTSHTCGPVVSLPLPFARPPENHCSPCGSGTASSTTTAHWSLFLSRIPSMSRFCDFVNPRLASHRLLSWSLGLSRYVHRFRLRRGTPPHWGAPPPHPDASFPPTMPTHRSLWEIPN